jgi:hypothetical protein
MPEKNDETLEIIAIVEEISKLYMENDLLATENQIELMRSIGKLFKKKDFEEIRKLRVSMWLDYCSFLLDELEEKFGFLFSSYCDISNQYKRFCELKRDFENLDLNLVAFDSKQDAQKFKMLGNLYGKMLKLKQEIEDDAPILLSEGKKNFIKNIYSWGSLLVSGVILAIWTITPKTFNENPLLLGLVWILSLIIAYFVSKKLFKPKIK